MNWLILSIITLVLWGVWALLAKQILNYVNWKEYLIVESIGTIPIILITYFLFRSSIIIDLQNRGIQLAIVSGILVSISYIVFYSAISSGKISVIVPLTSLYPLVTVILSFLLLKEKITLIQGIGIFLGLISIILLSL